MMIPLDNHDVSATLNNHEKQILISSAAPTPRSSGCDLAQSDADWFACEQREIAGLRSEHEKLVEDCGKMLPGSGCGRSRQTG